MQLPDLHLFPVNIKYLHLKVLETSYLWLVYRSIKSLLLDRCGPRNKLDPVHGELGLKVCTWPVVSNLWLEPRQLWLCGVRDQSQAPRSTLLLSQAWDWTHACLLQSRDKSTWPALRTKTCQGYCWHHTLVSSRTFHHFVEVLIKVISQYYVSVQKDFQCLWYCK